MRWLWKAAGFLGTAVLLSLLVNIVSTWLTSPQGVIPGNSPFGWLVVHWPITMLAGCLMLLLAMLTWVLSREQGQTPIATELSQQNREHMLQRLRRSYNDLLAQSLQERAWLELGLSSKPDAVQSQTRLLLHVPDKPARVFPPGTPLLEVYDEAAYELLVLGEPGVGKSTLLLSLARQLVERAEQDATHPLPVILPLASWAEKRSKLSDWMVEQLALIYNVPQHLADRWVQQEQILPLLDGLDEVEAPVRAACVEKINDYHHNHLLPLVICSRTYEYEAASKQERLALRRAVVVEPLGQVQVDSYLVQAGKSLAGLCAALKKNPVLRELATTPLMLSLLMLTYQGVSARSLPGMGSRETQQQRVFTNYVERMVECKGNATRYPLQQTLLQLGWLARQMQKHNQTVFYLEHLQPNWLPARQQRAYIWLAVRIPGILIGVVVSIVITLVLLVGSLQLSYLFQCGVLGGFLGGLWSGSVLERALPAPRKKKQQYTWGEHLTVSAFIGLLFGCSLGLEPIYTYLPDNWLHNGLIYGITFGLGSLFLQRLLMQSSSTTDHVPITGKRGTRRFQTIHGQHALLVAAIMGLSYGLSDGLSTWLNYGQNNILYNWQNTALSTALSEGLSFGLSVGLISLCVSLILGVQIGRDIHLTESLRWTWGSLKRSLLVSSHLRITLLLASSISLLFGLSVGLKVGLSQGLSVWVNDKLSQGLSFGLSYGPGYGLSYGLSLGLSYWFLFGLFKGIGQEKIKDQDRRFPNQGIRRSMHNSVIIGLMSGGMIGIMSILSYWLSYWLSNGLTNGWGYALSILLLFGLNEGLAIGLLLGICGGLLAFMIMGGLAVLRHFVIRLLLARSHTFPWQAIPFLEDATTRILLRRAGGGYSFAHRLLLDHFADTYPATALEETAKPSPAQASVGPSPYKGRK